jgi:hypothetical protein
MISLSDGIAIIASVLAVASFLYGIRKDREAKRERERASKRVFNRDQLDNFYSPALGKLEEIRAKSLARKKFSEAFSAAPEVERQKHIEERITFDNRVLREELLPRYRELADLFREQSGLIEPSTRTLYQQLINFIDLWEREGVPSSAIQALKDSGAASDPANLLHENAKTQVEEIVRILNED